MTKPMNRLTAPWRLGWIAVACTACLAWAPSASAQPADPLQAVMGSNGMLATPDCALRTALERDPTDTESYAAIVQAAESAGQVRNLNAQVQCLCALARAQFELGDLKKARGLLTQANDVVATMQKAGLFPQPVTRIGRPASMTAQPPTMGQLACARIAYEYLRGDLLTEALAIWKQAVDQSAHIGQHHAVSGLATQLNRRLLSLSPAQRYDVLHRWVLPPADNANETEGSAPNEAAGASSPLVRVFHTHCGADKPPAVFARLLGERPSKQAFPIPRVGGVEGLFSMEWLLIEAAQEQGRLTALTNEIRNRWEKQQADKQQATQTPRLPVTNESQRLNDMFTPANTLQYLRDLAELAEGAQHGPERLRSYASQFDDARFVQITVSNDGVLQSITAIRDSNNGRVSFIANSQSLQTLMHQALVVAAAGLAAPTSSEQVDAAEALIVRIAQRLPDLLSPHQSTRWIAAARHARMDKPLSSELAAGGLEHWLIADASPFGSSAGQPLWSPYDGQLVHWNSSIEDALLLRYPLEGDFEFSFVTTSNAGDNSAWGGVVSGGKMASISRYSLNLMDPLLTRSQAISSRFDFFHTDQHPTSNLFTVKVRDGRSTLFINHHEATTFDNVLPWWGLQSTSSGTALYRHLRFQGAPTVAREVRLSDDNWLRGWSTAALGRSRQPLRASPPTQRAEGLGGFLGSIFGADASKPKYDWQMQDQVIVGRKLMTQFDDTPDSLLTQVRPLATDESISYEFLYQPDGPNPTTAHPSLGRVAMLLEPTGAQLHWITNGPCDPSGLSSSNQVVDVFNRRGPKKLPLKADQWNTVEVSRNTKRASVKLNGVEVLQLPLDSPAPVTFGVYCDATRYSAKVRNVVLKGDWPNKLPAELFETDSSTDASDSPSMGLEGLADERLLASNSLEVYHEVGKLEDGEAYRVLKDWVLPNRFHGLRLRGAFTAMNPAPGREDRDPLDRQRLAIAAKQGQTRVDIGGNLVAPAMELVAVARRLGKLAEITSLVEKAPDTSDFERRSKLAMLTMLAVAANDGQQALKTLQELYPMVVLEKQPTGADGELRKQRWQRWPDMLAISVAVRHPKTRDVADSMSQHFYYQQGREWKWSGGEAWDRHAQSLSSHSRHVEKHGSLVSFHMPFPSEQWTMVNDVRSRSRGLGFSRTHWDRDEKGILKHSGHRDDRLYFAAPFRGDFEIEADIPIFNWRETHLMAAGSWAVLRYDLNNIRQGDLRTSRAVPIEPFCRPRDRQHLRIVVRGSTKVTYCNGREIDFRALPDDYDPWLLCRTGNNQLGGIHNLQITGSPLVPEEINLLPNGVAGWISDREFHSVDYENQHWWFDGEVFRGEQQLRGGAAEALTHYHRPMFEDGVVRYEFFYSSTDNVVVHPAMDRLALLMRPEGIAEHWVTDGRYDQHRPDPMNATVNQKYQRGEKLALKENDWNQVELRLAGDTLTVVVNGQEAYVRPLERTNQRTIGLFYYMDRERAQVRNMFWRGAWPREVPSLDSQELAKPDGKTLPPLLDVAESNVFRHDFSDDDAFPADRFDLVGDGGKVTPTAKGLRIQSFSDSSSNYRHSVVAPKVTFAGDFDITARFSDFNVDYDKSGNASALLVVVYDNEHGRGSEYSIRRVRSFHSNKDLQRTQAAIRIELPEGVQQKWPGETLQEATSGRLRMQRRGNEIYYSHAENDSEVFRFLWKETVTATRLDRWGIRLGNQVMTNGEIDVVLNEIEVRSPELEKLEIAEPQRQVKSLNETRDKLTKAWDRDYRQQDFDAEKWVISQGGPRAAKDRSGLQLSEQLSMSPQARLVGDFDISLDVTNMSFTANRGYSSFVIRWYTEQNGRRQPLIGYGAGRSENFTKVHGRKFLPSGATMSLSHFPLTAAPNETIELRLARRGDQLHIIYNDRLMNRLTCPTTPIQPGDLQLELKTAAGAESAVTLQRLQLHSAE